MEGGLRDRRRRIPSSLNLLSANNTPQQQEELSTPQAALIVSPRMLSISPTSLPTPLTSYLTTTLYQTTTTLTQKVTDAPQPTSVGSGSGSGSSSARSSGPAPEHSLVPGSTSHSNATTSLVPTSGSSTGAGSSSPESSSDQAALSADNGQPRTGAMLLAGVSSAAGVSLIGITAFFIAKRRRRPNNRNSLDATRARAIAGDLDRPYSSRYRL